MKRIAILIDGFSDLSAAKTAVSVIRYRRSEMVAVIDSAHAGQTAETVLGAGGDIPVVADLSSCPDADTLILGTAPSGGRLPSGWRATISAALRRGMTVVSGLHDRLSDDAELAALAVEFGGHIEDVRHSGCTDLATRENLRSDCLRIHAVGHDCNVGKMVVMLELEAELKRREKDAKFVATGQTGIMIAGSGISVDCVVSDFVNGAAERLVLDHQDHDILLIEGQGSLLSPMYSAVTCGLLHGCAPHGLILCYQVGRTHFRHTNVPIPPLSVFRDLYEAAMASLSPCRVIGVAVNGRDCTPEEGTLACRQIEAELNIPAVDVYRDGAGRLADAVEALRTEVLSC